MQNLQEKKHSQKPKQLNTGVAGPVLAGWICFVSLFAVCGIWFSVASIDGAVIASGTVTVKGKAKSVQHPDGGVVTAINVKDGQLVRKGTELLRLDDTMLKANLNIYTSKLREAVATRSRLLSELVESGSINWDRIPLDKLGISQSPQIELAQQRIFEMRRNFNHSNKVRLSSKITQYENQIQGINAQMNSLLELATLADQELTATQHLMAKGHGTETHFRQIKQRVADIAGRIGESVAALARTKNAIEEVHIQILQETDEFRSNVSTAVAEVNLNIQNVTQQLSVTKSLLGRTVITAPVDGIIHELVAHTIGGVLQPGATVLQIIPDSGDLQIEVAFDPKSVDELFVGQKTAVRMTSLNMRTTPELQGLVGTISPDVVIDPANNRSFYRAIITISQAEIDKLKGVSLVPGMPVEVFAKTGERSVMAYLMQPLTNQLTHAMREQ